MPLPALRPSFATTIAYSPGMAGASIKVSEAGGILVLEGSPRYRP